METYAEVLCVHLAFKREEYDTLHTCAVYNFNLPCKTEKRGVKFSGGNSRSRSKVATASTLQHTHGNCFVHLVFHVHFSVCSTAPVAVPFCHNLFSFSQLPVVHLKFFMRETRQYSNRIDVQIHTYTEKGSAVERWRTKKLLQPRIAKQFNALYTTVST